MRVSREALGRGVLVGGAFLLGLGLSWWLLRVRPGRPAGSQARADAVGAQQFRYRRIVCMSPAVSEIVFALGAKDRVVGVCEHTKYPPEALLKPTCGGFFNPNREAILALEPDLLITQGEAADLSDFARASGMGIVSLKLHDLESIFAETARAASVLQLDAQGDLLCAEMRYRLARVRARVAGKPPVPAVLIAGREPGSLTGIFAVGPGGFLNDVAELAGARNVLADLPAEYAVVSKEALLLGAPEVIVELGGEGAVYGGSAAQEAEARKVWAALADLPAVQQGRVHVVEETYALIPGPRVVLLAERLAAIFHPEGP